MSQIRTITCDICGKTKGPSNSWFCVISGEAYITVWFPDDDVGPGPIGDEKILDVCGEACALRLIQKKLEESRNAK